MTRINSLLVRLFLIISTTTTLAQPSQVGIIDFYGTLSNDAELRKCLPFITNDTLRFLTESSDTKAEKGIVDCLLSQPKVKQADVSFICCDEKEGKWIVFVGVDTKSKGIAQRTKTKDIKLSAAIKDSYDSLMNLIMEAIEKGEATENDSSGHSLMNYLPARKLQEKFITYADKNLSLLKVTLQHSKHAEQRRVAATVIAYYHDKAEVVNDLLEAVTDPDENVRNDAVRAIGIIANYAQRKPDLKIEIPADPFIGMINSISWTDRNKSSLVLLSLTNSRDKKLLKQLQQKALKPLEDMAKWKSNGHSMPGYIMLGRIAGWSDKEIMDGASSNKAASIEKMLAEINK